MTKRFLTVAEAARMLGEISAPTLYRAIRACQFPAIKIRGRYVVPVQAIDAMERDALTSGRLVDTAAYALAEK